MCKWQLPNILIMEDFNLRKYLAKNRLLKEDINTNPGIFGTSFKNVPEFEYNFNNVKVAAKEKLGITSKGSGLSIPNKSKGKKIGTINMYDRPSDSRVGIEYESGGTTQDTDFVSYEDAIEIIKDLAKRNLEEGILSTIGMIGAGILGFQFIKGMLRNILVRIGKNVNLNEEKLKEMVNTLTKKALLKGSKDDNMVIINWRNETNEKIESGEIKTLEQILSTLPETQN